MPSPDHAITTDPLLLDAIEIQRGPAAVRYGGNAVNGAVDLIDSKVPKFVPIGGLTGATEVRYGTGDEEKTVVGRVTAGIGQFAIHAEGARRRADDYNVPNAYGSDKLIDSFANSTSYAFGGSWITSKGYIGAAYSRMESEYGLPGHSHTNAVCHTHGLDLHCEGHGQWNDPSDGWNDDHTARINLRSERVDVRADYERLLPGIDHTRLRLSYTDYAHDEYDGPFRFSNYTNEVYDARLELTHAPLLGLTGTLGGQYSHGTFAGLDLNDAHVVDDPTTIFGYTGENNVQYVTDHYAVFLSESRSFGALDVEIAARKEWRKIYVPLGEWVDPTDPELLDLLNGPLNPGQTVRDFFQEYGAEQHPITHPAASHDTFQISLGATWNTANGYSTSLSLARTERAPSPRELYALGNNLATNSYEVGLLVSRRASSQFPIYSSDILETAKTANLTFRKAGGPVEFEVGLFHQDIDNYIFARLIETESEGGAPHNYLVYTAMDSTFTGIDGQVSYRFTPESKFTVFGDYVHARLKANEDNLPRIPPARLGARYEYRAGPVTGDLEYQRTFAQSRIASYETPTSGYNMVNATLAYRFDLGDTRSVELYARGTNLTNELAFAHTSFVKDQSPLRGRSVAVGMRHAF